MARLTNGERRRLTGTLYVVATPIGNLADASPRAIETLRSVALVACEDTRTSRTLLAHYGIGARTVALHEHNERAAAAKLLEVLREGKDVALVSDAGTPTLSDPGQALVTAAWAAGHTVVPIPGPSSVTAALSIAGYGGPGFTFVGYLPRKPGEMRRLLESLRADPRPAVAFESPFRIRKSLALIAQSLPERSLTVTRELTKVHEEVLRGTASNVLEALGDRARGEFTLVFAGA